MKKQLYLFAFLISSLAFSQSKERISLHLFDLPTGITIEEFQNDLDKANNIYEKNGFGVNKYKVYQVNSDDQAKEHRYMWLSTWSDDAEYKKAHSEEIDDFWVNYFTPKYEKMLDEHIYRKFFSVK
ncbi:MAG: hypothetical protein HON45_07490 [Polaribacter sp.]|jgi:hypothetical protein|nr:hypothetical protein [Polaribacter sp.]